MSREEEEEEGEEKKKKTSFFSSFFDAITTATETVWPTPDVAPADNGGARENDDIEKEATDITARRRRRKHPSPTTLLTITATEVA